MSETRKAVSISRGNFENMRCAYGITVGDIAKKADLSVATIRAYASNDTSNSGTHAHEYNEKKMNRVLEELIALKIDSIFDKPEKETEKKRKRHGMSDISRELLSERIHEYCKSNKITICDFCEMCDIPRCTLSSTQIRRYPLVSRNVIERILKATGWSEDELKNGIQKNESKPIPAPVKKEEEKPVAQNRTIYNRKLTAENGKYYIEYDIYVIQHKREEISMEKFIEEAQKC